MVFNGSYICGPIPVDKSSTTTACCPTGGLFSQWSLYGRNDANTLWIRTRECLTSDIGCACTGDLIQTTSTCPCPSAWNNYDTATCTIDGSTPGAAQAFVINHTRCDAVVQLQSTNYINTENIHQVHYCRVDGELSFFS
uniref:Uromodulin-like n=1 Tax=Caenorhabditis tropicalis TaxID=1561998 RepID=A0A1I7UM75_9PELO